MTRKRIYLIAHKKNYVMIRNSSRNNFDPHILVNSSPEEAKSLLLQRQVERILGEFIIIFYRRIIFYDSTYDIRLNSTGKMLP